MSRNIVKVCRGYCPELDRQMAIRVTFSEIRCVGMLSPLYKKIGYSCEHGGYEPCATAGEGGAECPIFKTSSI